MFQAYLIWKMTAYDSGGGKAIYWIKHKNGKVAPYTEEALNHFIDCEKAKDFKVTGKGRDL